MSNTLYYVNVKGTGSYVPSNCVTNHDLTKIVDTSDEWIRTRTGIEERHISVDENTSQLAYKAAVRALEFAGVSAQEVDLIICSTVTPDAFTPSTACIVQNLLGAKKAVAFDLNAACSGFVYGIAVAKQFIQSGVYKNVLVIGAEIVSKLVSWQDRNTCVLFGDGAGAVFLEQTKEKESILDFDLRADGSKGSLLECKALPVNPVRKIENQDELLAKENLSMQGGEVFKFAVKVMVEGIKTIVHNQNITMDDIDIIIPHQANYRIIESAAKALKVSIDRFYINLNRYGNTSSASIGIALDELNRSGKLQHGQKIILVGFGGGMTSGAVLIEW